MASLSNPKPVLYKKKPPAEANGFLRTVCCCCYLLQLSVAGASSVTGTTRRRFPPPSFPLMRSSHANLTASSLVPASIYLVARPANVTANVFICISFRGIRNPSGSETCSSATPPTASGRTRWSTE